MQQHSKAIMLINLGENKCTNMVRGVRLVSHFHLGIFVRYSSPVQPAYNPYFSACFFSISGRGL
jgi:hypothetical protein